MAKKNTIPVNRHIQRLLEELPDVAEYHEEIRWLRSHPAMLRAQIATRGEEVKISAREVDDAPSKSAVISLHHWVANPDKFFKMIATEARRALVRKDYEGEKSNFSSNFDKIVQPGVDEVEDDLSQLERLAEEARKQERREEFARRRKRNKYKDVNAAKDISSQSSDVQAATQEPEL